MWGGRGARDSFSCVVSVPLHPHFSAPTNHPPLSPVLLLFLKLPETYEGRVGGF